MNISLSPFIAFKIKLISLFHLFLFLVCEFLKCAARYKNDKCNDVPWRMCDSSHYEINIHSPTCFTSVL